MDDESLFIEYCDSNHNIRFYSSEMPLLQMQNCIFQKDVLYGLGLMSFK